MGIDFVVHESFIDWNHESQDAEWTSDNVPPDPTFNFLLKDPISTLNHFLPYLPRPTQASDVDWNNHLFGVASIVCDYISILRNVPIMDLLNQVKEDFLQRGIIMVLDTKRLKELKKEEKLKKKLKREAEEA